MLNSEMGYLPGSFRFNSDSASGCLAVCVSTDHGLTSKSILLYIWASRLPAKIGRSLLHSFFSVSRISFIPT